MKIKIPYVVVLIVAQLIMTFFGQMQTLDGTALVVYGGQEAVFGSAALGSVVAGVISYGPMVLAVLIVLAVIMEKQRRILAEIAAVICYVLGAAFMLRLFGNVQRIMEVYRLGEGDVEILLYYVITNSVVLNLFSGWIYFLVAARIQDEEVAGGHGALGTLGCMLLFVTGIAGSSFNLSFFNVLPMILQLCYIKRLPNPFVGGGTATTGKNIITVAVVLVLFFVGPTLGIGI